MSYVSNLTLSDAVALVLSSKQPAITTHAKPDADAFGSAVALTQALRQLSIDARVVLIPPIPAVFQTMRGYELQAPFTFESALPESDLLIIIDTGAWSQLSPMRPAIEPRLSRTLIIDHHLAGDIPAAHRYIDTSAAASGEIAAQFIDAMGAAMGRDLIDPTVADSLFIGIGADTGWFRFSNTRPYTHELAARLIRKGVDHAGLYGKLEQSDRLEKLALMQRAIASMQLLADGRVAVMTLAARDFVECKALIEETERFVDFPQHAQRVQAVAMVVEPPDNFQSPGRSPIRISLRSKPGADAVNVSALAQQFGGGGHARAAGAKINSSLADAVRQISDSLVKAVGQAALQSR